MTLSFQQSNFPSSALLTDLYQLTMLQGYFDQGMEATAVFEFFVRRLPPSRNFLVAAGLEQALDYLDELRFSPEELEWLTETKRFRREFIDYLGKLRFTGDVHAMPEGTIFFADEPILRVTAPLPQAQFVESRLINLLHFQTLIASKAARVVLVAQEKPLVDFGLRRAHGAEAGLLAARANYLAGFSSTATVLAGRLFNIPISGTMAHSFIQAHERESEGFEHFAEANPDNVVFLLDTYDTEVGAKKVTQLAPKLREKGINIRAVRLDSGDLADHARQVRKILDDGGLREVRIFASGHLDEYGVQKLLDVGAPIDGFGIGTKLDVSADAPYLDCVYKLQDYAGRPCRKRSEGKTTLPGRKQVYRAYDANGRMAFDTLTLDGDRQTGEALIVPVMHDGKRISPPASLVELRERAANQLARLPAGLRSLEQANPYEVKVSVVLKDLAQTVDKTSG